MTRPKVIFLGNGPLADAVKSILAEKTDIIFHARKKEDLEKVKKLKSENPDAFGVLASFGVIIKPDILELFEPTGILNIHPSKLPEYRGPSPIESAILNGDTTFGVSVMKLTEKMDAGPLYYQTEEFFDSLTEKSEIYEYLADLGASWLTNNLEHLPKPISQDDSQATYTKKLDTSMSYLEPEVDTAEEMVDQIRAFQGFPKTRLKISGIDCIILDAHPAYAYSDSDLSEPGKISGKNNLLTVGDRNGDYLVIDYLQPAGKRPMDARSFINGYLRR